MFLHEPQPAQNRAQSIAALLGTVYWWNSFPLEIFFYGMIGFPIASYLSILGISIFFRFVHDPSRNPALISAWLLFAAMILPLHAEAVLIFVPPMLALLVSLPIYPGTPERYPLDWHSNSERWPDTF